MSVRTEYAEMTAAITPHDEFVAWAKAPKPSLAERMGAWFTRPAAPPEDLDVYRWWTLDELLERRS